MSVKLYDILNKIYTEKQNPKEVGKKGRKNNERNSKQIGKQQIKLNYLNNYIKDKWSKHSK